MLRHLPGTARTAHAEILQRTAKTGQFMTLEVGYRNKSIGFDYFRAYGNASEDFPLDRDVYRGVSPQTVAHRKYRCQTYTYDKFNMPLISFTIFFKSPSFAACCINLRLA